MEAFIYYNGETGIAVDELEDELDDVLSNFGGEVTGTGRGEMGGNIDLEFEDESKLFEVIGAIKEALVRFAFPPGTRIVIGSETHSL